MLIKYLKITNECIIKYHHLFLYNFFFFDMQLFKTRPCCTRERNQFYIAINSRSKINFSQLHWLKQNLGGWYFEGNAFVLPIVYVCPICFHCFCVAAYYKVANLLYAHTYTYIHISMYIDLYVYIIYKCNICKTCIYMCIVMYNL